VVNEVKLKNILKVINIKKIEKKKKTVTKWINKKLKEKNSSVNSSNSILDYKLIIIIEPLTNICQKNVSISLKFCEKKLYTKCSLKLRDSLI
jgi:hypothetical protein